MRCASNSLDRGVAVRLLSHGAFLSTKVPPITKVQGLVLLAEAAVDDFVKEFKGIVRELLSGCQLSDLQATPAEMSRWFGERLNPPNTKVGDRAGESPQGNGGTLSHSDMCTEVMNNG